MCGFSVLKSIETKISSYKDEKIIINNNNGDDSTSDDDSTYGNISKDLGW